MLPKFASHPNLTLRQTLNQFALTMLVMGMLHINYSLAHYSGPWLDLLLPLFIDSAILLFFMAAIITFKFSILKLSFNGGLFLSNLSSTLIFFFLCYGIVLMLAYSAYTGDRFNISLIGYFISNASDLADPVVAETGYLPLFIFVVSAGVFGLILHRAHLLNTQHLIYIFLLAIASLLLARSYASHFDPRVYTFFSPPNNPILPSAEKDHSELPPWFRSFYLTMLGWDHAAYRNEEKAEPDAQYVVPVYQSQSGNRPNILLLTLESIRASATSPYNDSPIIRYLTPNLHELSQAGTLVKHAYSTNPHTSKALVGIFCGQFPRKEMEITESDPKGLPVACVPKLLAQAGYETAFFQSALGAFENRHGLTSNMGFQESYTQEQLPNRKYKKLSYVGMDDYVMLQPTIDWMKKQSARGKPFFAGLLTVVSHHPYSTPETRKIFHSYESPFLKNTFAAYLSSVTYTDRFIGDLMRRMQQAGLLKNTIVIITGDHGEAFAEHGPVFHNGTPHEEGMKVPLILYSPDLLPTPRQIDGLRSHLDLLPTILELTGIKVGEQLPGKSLLSSTGHESLAGACWYNNHCAIYYKTTGEKYIYWYGRKPNEYFQLRQDPEETTNLVRTLSADEERHLVRSTFSQLNGYQSVYRHLTNTTSNSQVTNK